VLTQTINDRRAWTATTIDAGKTWYHHLPDACLTALEEVRGKQSITDVILPEPMLAECARSLEPVRAALETGRGFAIIQSPALSIEDATLLYWIVGQALGRPFAQNVQGTMLYDVRDTGQDLSKGARFSVTSYESSFHTDNSFGIDVLDYVGLLCVQVAKSGGRSQIVSGYAVHHELMVKHPDALATLYEPFHVDRRGGIREGQTPTIRFPVFTAQGSELIVRYLRYWIEAGHEKVGQPLTAAQRAALDTLDAVLNRRELRVEFDLKPGDMYFINNRWTLHNRTAFEDHPDPERRRHLVRLWLQQKSPGTAVPGLSLD
jgi:alpha-ketoglutarate-dependent taurine dioxygenase